MFYNIIEKGNLSDLKGALKIYNVNAQDEEGMTLLAWACISGSKRKVSYLLEQGANPNIICNEGRTPLMYAASNDFPEVIKLLLTAGADPKIGDKSGWTAETWADLFWNEKSKFVLREHRKKITYQHPRSISSNKGNKRSR